MWYSYFLSRLRKQICSDAMPTKYMIWLFQLSCANKSKNGLSSVHDEVGNLSGIHVPWKPAAIQSFLGNLNQVAELRKKKKSYSRILKTKELKTSIIWAIAKCSTWASQEVLVVKNPFAKGGVLRDMGSILGSGIYPKVGHGNSLQCSCWKNLKAEELGGLQSIASDWS